MIVITGYQDGTDVKTVDGVTDESSIYGGIAPEPEPVEQEDEE